MHLLHSGLLCCRHHILVDDYYLHTSLRTRSILYSIGLTFYIHLLSVLYVLSTFFAATVQWFLVQEIQCGERNSIFLLMSFLLWLAFWLVCNFGTCNFINVEEEYRMLSRCILPRKHETPWNWSDYIFSTFFTKTTIFWIYLLFVYMKRLSKGPRDNFLLYFSRLKFQMRGFLRLNFTVENK